MDRKRASELYETAAAAIRELADAGQLEELSSIAIRTMDGLLKQPGTNKKVCSALAGLTDAALRAERLWSDK
jgi:hypothetical protein